MLKVGQKVIKILTLVYGTRGELIKFSSLIIELKRHNIDFSLVDTAQQDTTDITNALNLPNPDMKLPNSPRSMWTEISGIKKLNVRMLGPYGLTASVHALKWLVGIVHKLKKVFVKSGGPVMFVGNTMTVCAAVIAAKSCKLKLISYEAGLRTRSNELLLDWPYKLGDKLSDILFVRAQSSREVLLSEDVSGEAYSIENPVVDIVKIAKNCIKSKYCDKSYVLANTVRSLTTKTYFKNYVDALIECNRKVILAPNNAILQRLKHFGLLNIMQNAGIKIIQPTNYVDYIKLLTSAALAITDSNGVEEECSVLGKHCVVTNNFIQYPELKENVAIVTGCDKRKMLEAIKTFYGRRSKSVWKSGGTKDAAKIIGKVI